MRRSNFALRLQPSLIGEARKVAEAEGVALNQLINVALAEKLSALRTESYFEERRSGRMLRKLLAFWRGLAWEIRRFRGMSCRGEIR